MIGRLRGQVWEKGADSVLVDCNGVGYEVRVSAHTWAQLPPVGDDVVLRIFSHTNPQDYRSTLFGFIGFEERELFDLLITVKRVGPSAAMDILSGGLLPTDIVKLIAGGEVARLVKIKGVGKKTAEMLVVELRDKCELVLAQWGAGASPAPEGTGTVVTTVVRDPKLADVATALVQLGWRQSEADKAVDSLDMSKELPLETLLRRALQAMPR
jgi:Holliday junction DNA helicase RuvA